MRSARRRLFGGIAAVFVLLAVAAVPASASETITISNDQAVIVGPPGSVIELARVTVEPAMVGSVCTLRVVSHNQASVHPGNDLVVTTGESVEKIADIEAAPDADADLSASVVLGPTITVELVMGPDYVSSIGFDLDLDCGTTAPVLVGGDACPTGEGGGAADDADAGCGETGPEVEGIVEERQPTEVPVPPPVLPEGCPPGDGDGSLVVDPTVCPGEPEPETEPAPSPSPSIDAPAAPADEATAPTTTATSGPDVLGLQLERLPVTPAAGAVHAVPSYTG